MVYLGADHGGFRLKESVRASLLEHGWIVTDLTPHKPSPRDDYPKIAERVAAQVAKNSGDFGVLICRSGVGMAMVANKVPGIRAVQGTTARIARQARSEEAANVLSLGGDVLSRPRAIQTVLAFVSTPFSRAARHRRRVGQLRRIDANYRRPGH